MNTTTVTTNAAKQTARRGSRRRRVLGLVASVLTMGGVVAANASPAAAVPEGTYASSSRYGMWHMGTVDFYQGNSRFNLQVRFNDNAGDQWCTQLKAKAYATNGAVDVFSLGSVCSGRAGTISTTLIAPTFHRFTQIDIWTVRADGGLRSYVWDFQP